MKKLAWAYTALVLSAAAWAWWVDVSMLTSSKEHLLPDMLLAFVGLPLSLTLDIFYTVFEVTFSKPLIQVAFLTCAAALQAGMLHALASWQSRTRHQRNAA